MEPRLSKQNGDDRALCTETLEIYSDEVFVSAQRVSGEISKVIRYDFKVETRIFSVHCNRHRYG